MKKSMVILCVVLLVFGVVGIAGATLEVIGTASYLGSSYNLIYEKDQGLVWLDYTKSPDTWQNQVDWASGLGTQLTVNLNPKWTTTIDWTTGWRLPSAGDNPQSEMDQANSEMGHLYYVSLGKTLGGPLGDPHPFDNLQAYSYWSGTEDTHAHESAWLFMFDEGQPENATNTNPFGALAVRPREACAPVPEPATMLLIASGLVGLTGLRRKLRER
jgi:hypothetical protein